MLVCSVISKKIKDRGTITTIIIMYNRHNTGAVTKKRTLQTLCEHSKKGSYGVIHEPIIKIEIDKVKNTHIL